MLDQNNDEIQIDVREVLSILLAKWWIILSSTVLAAAAGFCICFFFVTPIYESTTGIYVMSKQNSDTLSYSDTQLSSQLTKDYEELIRCRSVLEEVIEICGLNEDYNSLYSRVSVENTKDTRIIYITVKDPRPKWAQYIANNIRIVASEHIKNVTDIEAVNIVDEANLPTRPSEPSKRKWTIIAALIGAFLSSGIIFLVHILDDTIKTSDDVEKYLGWGTLAVIPVIETNDGKKKKKKKAPKSSVKSINISNDDEILD